MSRKVGMIFKDAMVRAIIAGRKWQTRRPLLAPTTPRASPGDKIWVREKWADLRGMGFDMLTAYGADTLPGTDADEIRKQFGVKWKPSIHLPRARARIFLPLVRVWEERIRDISSWSAEAEGIEHSKTLYGARESFRAMWDEFFLNRPTLFWSENPWVRVYEWDPQKIVVL